MPRKVLQFRRLKHGDPEKLKVLAEDLRPLQRPVVPFAAWVVLAAAIGFALVYFVGGRMGL